MDDAIIEALMSKFGMAPEVARNQPPAAVQGARRGVSRGSTNAEERAKIRQNIETGEPDEYGEVTGPTDVDDSPSDSMISDAMWKIIQEVDPKDGEKFYQLKGQQAMDTLGLGKDAADLAGFWDQLSPEDRYYLIRALDMNIGGPASDKQIMDDTMRGMDEDGEASDTEKALIDQIMKQEMRQE